MENKFRLYTKNGELSKEGLKATKMIKSAVRKKNWNEVERLQKKYKEEGAWDTASTEEILKYWKKVNKTYPKGFI